MIQTENLISIGKIRKTHSYRGELVGLFDYDANLFSGEKDFPIFLEIDHIPVPFFIESIRGNSPSKSMLKFENIDTEKEAAELAGKEMLVEKDRLAEMLGVSEEELDEANDDLTGYKVYEKEGGRYLGTVTGFEEGLEYDYLVVEDEKEEREITIPLVEEFVEEIAEESDERKIIVDLPEGFLDI